MKPGAAWGGVLVFVLGMASAQEEVRVLSPEEQRYFADYGPTGIDPEELLNCDLVDLVGSPVDLIIQLPVSAHPYRASRLRAVGKELFRALMADPTSPLAVCAAQGGLGALEFDWITPETEPDFPDRLSCFVSFLGENGYGDPVLLARAYGLSPAQYAARRSQLEAINGLLQVFDVWLSDTLVAEETALVGGVASGVYGRTTGLDVTLTSIGFYLDGAAYAGELTLGPWVRVPYEYPLAAAPLAGLSVDVAALEQEALVQGNYYPGDVTFDALHPLPSGVVFADGNVTVAQDEIDRVVTLVATGGVAIHGNLSRLAAARDRTLAVALTGDVTVTGFGVDLFGELRAPQGAVRILASASLAHGALVGRSVAVLSAFTTVTDGTHPVFGSHPSF